MNNDNGGGYQDTNNKFFYPLQYLHESKYARDDYQLVLYRMALAMSGKPWRNLYQEELKSNIKKIVDTASREKCEKGCLKIPEGQDFTLMKAVNTRANQMASGVDTYEYSISDPYMIIDPDTEDLLATKCEQDYKLNRLGVLAPTFSRDLTTAGLTAVEIRYCPWTDKNTVVRIAPKNCIFDTRYSSTGEERFRGYNMMISWSELKKMIAADDNEEVNLNIKAPDRSILTEDKKHIDQSAKYHNRKIRSLNGLDIYVETLNKLATSADLARSAESFAEFRHDLRDCYNVNWYRSFATDPEAETNNGYSGDDVELTVLYDLKRRTEFKIVNRRYVISANSEAFHRKIVFPVKNPVTGEVKNRIDDFELPCPLKFQFENEETRDTASYPISTAMKLLDYHDQLCALRAKRKHVTDILSILRVETNGGDAESLRGMMNIMGIVLDDIQGDISTVNFAYDFTPIDSEIQYLQNEIKTALNAYTDFDAMQAMGDRASAAEAGNAIGAIAQGLATHQNAIMELYADIARQCIANRVAYSPDQEFSVVADGDYRTLTVQQMALTATISVKSKMAKKIQEKMLAANALTILGSMKDALTSQGIAYFAEQAMYGNAPRKMVMSFINEAAPTEKQQATAELEAQNMASQLAQNEQAYQQNPVSYEAESVVTNPNNTPEDIDAIIAGVARGERGTENVIPQAIDMPEQEGAVVSGLPNQVPDTASAMVNPNSL